MGVLLCAHAVPILCPRRARPVSGSSRNDRWATAFWRDRWAVLVTVSRFAQASVASLTVGLGTWQSLSALQWMPTVNAGRRLTSVAAKQPLADLAFVAVAIACLSRRHGFKSDWRVPGPCPGFPSGGRLGPATLRRTALALLVARIRCRLLRSTLALRGCLGLPVAGFLAPLPIVGVELCEQFLQSRNLVVASR